MTTHVFRLWSTEHLVTWPNRLHLVTIVLVALVWVVPVIVLFEIPWFGLAVESGLLGSLVWRIRHWDAHRTDEFSDCVTWE